MAFMNIAWFVRKLKPPRALIWRGGGEAGYMVMAILSYMWFLTGFILKKWTSKRKYLYFIYRTKSE